MPTGSGLVQDTPTRRAATFFPEAIIDRAVVVVPQLQPVATTTAQSNWNQTMQVSDVSCAGGRLKLHGKGDKMSEEAKKPVEDLESKAEEKKDASGQWNCAGLTHATCGNALSVFGIRPGRCGGSNSGVCGVNVSAI